MYEITLQDGESAIVFKCDESLEAFVSHEGADSDYIGTSAVQAGAVMMLFGDHPRCAEILQELLTIMQVAALAEETDEAS